MRSPPDRTTLSAREQQLETGANLSLWMIGRIEFGHKNNQVLPDILDRLVRAGKSATLDIVGDGRDTELLKAQIERLGLSNRVVFHGWSATPWDHVPQDAIVVIPSFYESMCIVAREAMSRGVRLVVSPIPVFHEWIPEALIVDNFSVEAFSRKVGEVQAIKQTVLEDWYVNSLARFSVENFVESFGAHLSTEHHPST